LPIPKEWSLWRRVKAWLVMGDDDQALGDRPLYLYQKFFRWLFKNRRKGECAGCGRVFVPKVWGDGHCLECLGIGNDGRFL